MERRDELNAWNEAEKDQAGGLVVSTAKHLWESQSWRRDRARRALSAYYGREINSLHGDTFSHSQGSWSESDVKARLVYGLVETAQSKIAARMRPKPSLLTKGGDYALRLQAKEQAKYLEGWLHQRHERYSNAWELTEQMFADACLFEFGCIKTYADQTRKRITYERCMPWEFLVDPDEAYDGEPRNLFQVYRVSRRRLLAAFKGEKKLKPLIQGASGSLYGQLDAGYSDYGRRNQDLVDCYEAWLLPECEDEPGRHVIAVDSGHGDMQTGVSLVDEPWTRPVFPIVRYMWQQDPIGWFGTPLVDLAEGMQEQANELIQRIAENSELGGGGYIDVEEGTYDLPDLENNESFKLLVKKVPGARDARVHMPQLFNQQLLQAYQLFKGESHSNSGISEMTAQGRKEPGVDSGVAIRTVNDLQDQRFLKKSRRYEQVFVDLARQTIFCTQELKEAGIKPEVMLPGAGKLESIKWDFSLKENMFEIRVDPTSSASDTLAGRLQTLQELAANGVISPETVKQAALSLNPDLESLSRREQAQYHYVERLIGRFQVAAENEAGVYEAPDPLLNLGSAVAQMTEAYTEMLDDDAPEFRRTWVRDWIQAADELIQRASAPAPPEPAMGQVPMPQPPPEAALPPAA